MILNKRRITEYLKGGTLVIDPLSRKHLQSASVQLSLGCSIKRLRPGQVIDPRKKKKLKYDSFEMPDDDAEDSCYTIGPNDFILGHTYENIRLPPNVLGMLDGRSTMARLGLVDHITAMFIWPGHGSKAPRPITLEIKNNSSCPIVLSPRLFIANFVLIELEEPVEEEYDSAANSTYSNDHAALLPRLGKRNYLKIKSFIKPAAL